MAVLISPVPPIISIFILSFPSDLEFYLPEAYGAVAAGGHKILPICAPGDRHHIPGMIRDHLPGLPGARIPDTDRLIPAAGGQPDAASVPGDRPDAFGMALQRPHQ